MLYQLSSKIFPAAVFLNLVAIALASDHGSLSARAGSPFRYPAVPPFQPGIVPRAVKTICKEQPGDPIFIHSPGKSGIVLTLGNCKPPQGGLKRDELELRDDRNSSQWENEVIKEFGDDRDGKESSSTPGSGLQSRQQECKYPPNHCTGFPGGEHLMGFARCAVACAPNCDPGTDGDGPSWDDCDYIWKNFLTRPHVAFAIPQDKFVLFTYKTCATGIYNHIDTRHIASPSCRADLLWDYVDWASSGQNLMFKCHATLQSGHCFALGGPDFFMKVYSN